MAILGGLLPLDGPFILGGARMSIPSSMDILGRQLVIDPEGLTLVVLLFSLGSFWFLGIRPARAHRRTAPLGMIILGLSIGALSVRPFLYSAIFLELIVLVSVPLLVPAGATAGKGVLRYLIFMTLALPFILLAGTMADRAGQNLMEGNQLIYAVTLLLLGFALWLAVFPLYTWVPMVSEEAPPYITGFLLSIQSSVALLVLRKFMFELPWLSDYSDLSAILKIAGILMAASAGIWAAFQTNLARLMGYAVIFENGLALILLGLNGNPAGFLFAASLPPRLLGIAIMALALAGLRREGLEATTDGVQGVLFKKPVIFLSFLIALFSMAGFPLLAGFPVRLVMFTKLAESSMSRLIWVGIGMFGLILAGIRIFLTSIQRETSKWQVDEDRLLSVMLIFGVLLVLLMGLFPALTLNWIAARL